MFYLCQLNKSAGHDASTSTDSNALKEQSAMNIYSGTPFTYYISWSKLNLHYYGVRYAIGCDPSELWTKYFSSSTYVKRLRKNYGEPDIIQVRKTFTSSKNARKWESTVIRRIRALNKMHWLNCANQSIRVIKNFDGYLSGGFGYIFSPLQKTTLSEQNKKHKWWNNGESQVFRELPPDADYKRGRLAFNNTGAKIGTDKQRGKIWINNILSEMMVLPNLPIPEGFTAGRIKSPLKGKLDNHAKGRYWWTNGTHTKMSTVSPGPLWRVGRL